VSRAVVSRALFLVLAPSVTLWRPAPCAAQADAPAAPTTTSILEPAARVDALIAELSSDDWPRRQDAEEQLVQLAADAVPRLRETAETAEDAEVRARCESALHRIAVNERIGPTIVTLHLAGATPREAFEALARESGVALRPHPPTLWDHQPAAARVTLDVEHRPFWEAARQLTTATGLELRPLNDELRVMQSGDRRQRGPAAVSGPLLIVANTIHRASSVDLGSGVATNEFSVTFTVLPELKLRVLRSWPSVRVEEAVDEHGTSLVAAPVRPDSYHATPRQSSWQAAARLSYPPNAGKRIARLRGAVAYVAQTHAETVEIRDLLAAREVRRELSSGAVTVQQCRQMGGQYELVLVLVRSRPPGAVQWDARHALLPGLRVYDAQGRALQRGQSSTSGSDERVELTVRFAAEPGLPHQERPGPPARLVWEIPTEWREISAPFEFTDLPLP
jgi:hypothetical protein